MLRRLALATLDVIRGIIVCVVGVPVTAAGLWLAHHVVPNGDT